MAGHYLYRPDESRDGVEYAIWSGGAPPQLPLHFHDSAQLTLVLAGHRDFLIESQTFHVVAGQALLIPAGRPHVGLSNDEDTTRYINLYVETAAPDPRVIEAADARSIGDLAADMGVSREHFSRCFRRETGMSPHAFRLMLRLNEAKRQLKTGADLADLAADLGFADQSHLGKHFRRAFGTTPDAYRRGMITKLPDAG